MSRIEEYNGYLRCCYQKRHVGVAYRQMVRSYIEELRWLKTLVRPTN